MKQLKACGQMQVHCKRKDDVFWLFSVYELMNYSFVGRRKKRKEKSTAELLVPEVTARWPEERGFLSVSHMENRCVDDVCTRLAVSSDLHVALG